MTFGNQKKSFVLMIKGGEKVKYLVLVVLSLLIMTTICVAQPEPETSYTITLEELEEFNRWFWGDNWKYIYRYRVMGIQTPRFVFLEEYLE